jgi:hypothetical protein
MSRVCLWIGIVIRRRERRKSKSFLESMVGIRLEFRTKIKIP